MSSKEENRYFQQVDSAKRAALRKQLAEKAKASMERSVIGGELGTDSRALVGRIQALGFDDDTARAFDVLPLIHVAWADGSVSSKERNRILEVLESRGVAKGSEAFLLVESLLEKEPSKDFVDESLSILSDVFEAGGGRATDIVTLCVEVAHASGGFLGLGSKVSEEEKTAIKHIADKLGPAAEAAFKKQLG